MCNIDRNLIEYYNDCIADLEMANIKVSDTLSTIRFADLGLSTLGRCIKKGIKNGFGNNVFIIDTVIEINTILRDHADRIPNTLMHELIHSNESAALDGHRGLWLKYANKINAMYPEKYHITRCNSFPELTVALEPKAKYKIVCSGCGTVWYRERASQITKNPSRYSCGNCGGNLTVEKL